MLLRRQLTVRGSRNDYAEILRIYKDQPATNNDLFRSYLFFILHDIDRNGIPELFICDSSTGVVNTSNYSIAEYTHKEGGVAELGFSIENVDGSFRSLTGSITGIISTYSMRESYGEY